MGVASAVCPLEAPNACNTFFSRVTSGCGTFSVRSVVDLGGRRAVDIGWAWLFLRISWIQSCWKWKCGRSQRRRGGGSFREGPARDFFLRVASALKYGGKNTLLFGESLSVGSVLFENESRYVHLLIDWYFYWKPNMLGVPSYRVSHVSGKGVPKSREINIGMRQRRRQRVPQKWASKERRDCTRAVTDIGQGKRD